MAPGTTPTTAGRGARKGGERKSKSARAGLFFFQFIYMIVFNTIFIYIYQGVLFSVPRFHRYIKKSSPKSRVTMAAAVYTSAVVRSIVFFCVVHYFIRSTVSNLD